MCLTLSDKQAIASRRALWKANRMLDAFDDTLAGELPRIQAYVSSPKHLFGWRDKAWIEFDLHLANWMEYGVGVAGVALWVYPQFRKCGLGAELMDKTVAALDKADVPLFINPSPFFLDERGWPWKYDDPDKPTRQTCIDLEQESKNGPTTAELRQWYANKYGFEPLTRGDSASSLRMYRRPPTWPSPQYESPGLFSWLIDNY